MSDVDWRQVPEVHFWPWIGERFKEPDNGLLVLGESHYGTPSDDYPELTRDVVAGYLKNTSGSFFTNVAQVVTGKHWTEDGMDIRSAWHSVAFYNYVPVLLPKARLRPTPEQWDRGSAPFLAVVDALRPAQVLVLGHDLWGHVPGRKDKRIELTGKAWDLYYVPAGDREIPMLPIMHPKSGGFSWRAMSPWVSALRSFSPMPRRG